MQNKDSSRVQKQNGGETALSASAVILLNTEQEYLQIKMCLSGSNCPSLLMFTHLRCAKRCRIARRPETVRGLNGRIKMVTETLQ